MTLTRARPALSSWSTCTREFSSGGSRLAFIQAGTTGKNSLNRPHLKMLFWVFARSAFKIASGMVPTGEEARKFFRRKEAAEKYFRVAPGSKSLRSDMNREWQRWEKRMRAEAA